ncbi:unnamed protein product [Rodentolepis nana]|uniref:Zf-3CxxC domain-containing protein n=1 Tax=Rodentolepis nana TaxID=102285 RepID=A0A0R3TDP8_RODNA|nr:unnamed protein product [Rodentolepis nana]
MTRRTPLTQWDTETESPPQERTQTICTCLHCTMRYLSDYEYNKASIWTLSSQDSDENALYLIDENLHNNLHILWIGEFINLFSPLSAITGIFWYLRPVDLDERVFYPPIWNSSVKAKVRFECESCGNIWTSMRGIAVFSVHPNEIYLNALNLRFTLLGQRCNNCDSKVFQSAIWYPEEVIRVSSRVFEQTRQRMSQ